MKRRPHLGKRRRGGNRSALRSVRSRCPFGKRILLGHTQQRIKPALFQNHFAAPHKNCSELPRQTAKTFHRAGRFKVQHGESKFGKRAIRDSVHRAYCAAGAAKSASGIRTK